MYFLFDIGGTHMRGAVSDGETILKKKIIETPDTFGNGMEQLAALAKELAGGNQIIACAGGVPGVLHKDRKSLFIAPHLTDWIGKPIVDTLGNALNAPVSLENDAAIAALGEANFGAGKNHRIVMYYTIGTGIGGARVVDGKLDARVFSSEPGHQIIDIDGSVKSKMHALESLASGSGISQYMGKSATEIKDRELWEETEKYLAVGIFNSILHWSPDIVILGGGIANEGIVSVANIQKLVNGKLVFYPEKPEFAKAQLGDESAFYGCLAYLKDY